MSAKCLDRQGRWRNKTVAFRVSPEEDELLETAVKMQDGRLWIKRQCVGGLMAVKDALKRGSLWKTINEGRVTQ